MNIKTEPKEIWSEYEKLQKYLANNNIYEIVKNNENFYIGKQWEGMKALDMPKPVINILQRGGKYMIATISSNDISVSITPFSKSSDDIDKMKPIANEVEKVIELGKFKEDSKMAIRNAFVDGACYAMQSFDPDYETGQPLKGRIVNNLVDITNMYMGNPYSNDIQSQPFIIVSMRQHVEQVREEARIQGLNEDEVEMINADNDSNQSNDDSDNLCTVLLKFYKKRIVENEEEITIENEDGSIDIIRNERKSVFFTKTTKDVTIIKETNLGYSRYPIACFGWDPIKNSCLYTSPMTSIIPNQIFINKCFGIAQAYGLQNAFPKVVIDRNKANLNDITKNPNSTISVSGLDMMGKLLDFIKAPDFSNQIIHLIDTTISQTKECMGVNDAALGNVKPDNTSAIIALQEATNLPLELQRQSFYGFWEDIVRNIVDIMANDYGLRKVRFDNNGVADIASVDFSLLKEMNYEINVDIGNGAQYSEIAQMQTLDKIYGAQMIDEITYMESIPSKYVPNKGKIMQYLKQKKEQPVMQQQIDPNAQNINLTGGQFNG